MDRVFVPLLAVALLVSLFAILVPAKPAYTDFSSPVDPPTHSIVLVTSNIGETEYVFPGDTFRIEIIALWVEGLSAWDGALIFDPGYATPTGRIFPGFLDADLHYQIYDDYIQFEQDAESGLSDMVYLAGAEFEAVQGGRPKFFMRYIDLRGQELYAATRAYISIHPGECLGDFADPWGFRNLADIMAMLPAWNTDTDDEAYRAYFDLYPLGDPDGYIDLADIYELIAVWNTPCP